MDPQPGKGQRLERRSRDLGSGDGGQVSCQDAFPVVILDEFTYLMRNGDRLAREYSPEAALQNYLRAIDLMRNAPQPDNRSILAAYQRVGELALAAGRAGGT